jgi:hypothetical protein
MEVTMMRLTFAAVAALAGVFFAPPAQAYEAPWCAVIELSKGSAYWDCHIARSMTAIAEAIFWLAIAGSAMQARIMPPTSQNNGAPRNAALTHSSGAIGHLRD